MHTRSSILVNWLEGTLKSSVALEMGRQDTLLSVALGKVSLLGREGLARCYPNFAIIQNSLTMAAVDCLSQLAELSELTEFLYCQKPLAAAFYWDNFRIITVVTKGSTALQISSGADCFSNVELVSISS